MLKHDSGWEIFLTHFEEVNHGLLTKLRNQHSELAANDIRFLSYLYMDRTTTEIASLFNITVEAVRKRKERISNKIGLDYSTTIYATLPTHVTLFIEMVALMYDTFLVSFERIPEYWEQLKILNYEKINYPTFIDILLFQPFFVRTV